MKRIRFRWSLRGMLLTMLLVCVALGTLTRPAMKRRRLAALAEQTGWRVVYEYEANQPLKIDPATLTVITPNPEGPELRRAILGIPFFNKIAGVHATLKTEDDHKLFSQLTSQQSITFLNAGGSFQTRDANAIGKLSNLKKLDIDLALLTPKEIRDLEETHPSCDIYVRIMEPPKPSQTENN